ncbi:MAG: hypothetical protein PWQ18_1479 [Clostridia bacterium]|uniref:YgiT-type zinc finger domain-containing protein n=1 Tax=Neomoorella glycerini TaxID=55779 RepID=A0A6I5ZPN8_9FIRM|nr:type II toxin-antitoxin system MqsA family antitoxin [Moorella glycerini]MDN5345365.1 hypothetical protein [Clostridia bacterium]QGP91585.1 hypothetical protein MGLY_09210 [Moorella glycerini]
MTKCPLCGSKVRPKKVRVENWWGDKLTLVENVPAWVCEECGEQYYDAETTLQLEEIRKEHMKPKRIIEVPVYDFREPVQRRAKV